MIFTYASNRGRRDNSNTISVTKSCWGRSTLRDSLYLPLRILIGFFTNNSGKYFRPNRLKFLSYGYVLHNLILTRSLIAAGLWAREHADFTLVDKRICYELPGIVIPDGWLLFEKQTPQGVYEQPIIFELDRGMENKDKFRVHVRGRINYIQSGEYKKTFKTDVATIAYATTGQTEAYKITRRKVMCTWIAELLKDMRMESWAGVFRVASVEFGSLYDNALFETDVWHRPDAETAVRLFE